MTFSQGSQILNNRYELVHALPVSSGSPYQTWIARDKSGYEYLAKIWPLDSKKDSDLQRALWDSELRKIYRLCSSPGAEDSLLTVREPGVEKGDDKGFCMILKGDSHTIGESLETVLSQSNRYSWLNTRDFGVRREMWQGLFRLAKGIRLMHEQRIMHRNIHAGNVFLDATLGPESFRLTGFEWSIRLGEPVLEDSSRNFILPPWSSGILMENDWYGFGQLAAQLLQVGDPEQGVREDAKTLTYLERIEFADNALLTKAEKEFLLGLVHPDPAARLKRSDRVLARLEDLLILMGRSVEEIREGKILLVVDPRNTDFANDLQMAGFQPTDLTDDNIGTTYNFNDQRHLSQLTDFIFKDMTQPQLFATDRPERFVLVGDKVTIQHPRIKKILDMVFRGFLKTRAQIEMLPDCAFCRPSVGGCSASKFVYIPRDMVLPLSRSLVALRGKIFV
ncbi:MAG: hypothetical protein H7839_22490 [Magnetococcus sp. YQC-5]